MFRNNRRLLLTCLAVLAACLCLGALGLAGAAWYAYQNAPQLLTGSPCAGLPDPSPLPDANSQMDQIESQVIGLRGLQPSGPVKRGFLTYAELRQHVLDNFFKDYTAQDELDNEHELAALGLLQKGFDLQKFYQDLYSEQIAGFYDQETKDMYVVQDKGFGGSERMTYAHEYTHVLQDQNYDIRDGLKFSDAACKKDSERCAAISSLLEGDATLTEQKWFGKYATQKDCSDVTNFYLSFQSPVFNSAPPFMKQDFVFPYVQGKEFVQYLLDAGGEKAVDAAYSDVPLSTEQILHPERYPGDKPLTVSLPDLSAALGEGWSEIDRGVMGEWYTYLILAAGVDPNTQLPESQAKSASAGWGGDAYAVYYNAGKETAALVLKTTWDTAQDAQEFAQSFSAYAGKRFSAGPTSSLWTSPDGMQAFAIQGSTTYWYSAPDQAHLDLVRQALSLP